MKNEATISKIKEENAFIKANVSKIERIVMIAAGGYLLYNTISKKENNITKTSTAAALLLRGITGYCPVYGAIETIKNNTGPSINVKVKLLINRPVSEIYSIWRDFENLPKFMGHLQSVNTIDNNTTKWVAEGFGQINSISWTAKIVEEVKDKIIRWQSTPDSQINNSGKVTFTPKVEGTEISISISYQPPLNDDGENTAHFFNPNFKRLIKKDVKNFKFFIENLKDMK